MNKLNYISLVVVLNYLVLSVEQVSLNRQCCILCVLVQQVLGDRVEI